MVIKGDSMNKELETAKHFVTLILQNNDNITAEALYELYEIKKGNKQILALHLEALSNIFTKAYYQIEKQIMGSEIKGENYDLEEIKK